MSSKVLVNENLLIINANEYVDFFSFQCSLNYHAPASCDIMRNWLNKCRDVCVKNITNKIGKVLLNFLGFRNSELHISKHERLPEMQSVY